MTQYIKKSALVAKIKKRFDEYSSSILKHYDACKEAKAQELGKILIILDTLEVKEVNLEKEAELIANGIMIGVQANKYNTVVYNTARCDFNHSHLMLAARKGIELGLKASNPTTAAERKHRSMLRAVYQCDKDGNIINRFESVYKAGETLGIKPQNITATLTGRQKTCGGFKFFYVTKYDLPDHGFVKKY